MDVKARSQGGTCLVTFGSLSFLRDSRRHPPVWTIAHAEDKYAVARIQIEDLQQLSSPALSDKPWMSGSHLFAFGSNPFGKACPGHGEVIVNEPIDVLPTLLEGNLCDIDLVEVLQGSWDSTLIRLGESELESVSV